MPYRVCKMGGKTLSSDWMLKYLGTAIRSREIIFPDDFAYGFN